jgi:hypothetical protein
VRWAAKQGAASQRQSVEAIQYVRSRLEWRIGTGNCFLLDSCLLLMAIIFATLWQDYRVVDTVPCHYKL